MEIIKPRLRKIKKSATMERDRDPSIDQNSPETPSSGKEAKISAPDASILGPLIMTSAALQFAVMNFTVKLLGPSFSAWHIAFYRFTGGVIVLLLIILGQGGGRGRNPYKGVNYRLLIIRGINGSIAFLGLVTALKLLPLSTAMVIFYTYPVFAGIFAVWIYGETIRRSEGACILMVVAGACLLFEFEVSGRPLGEFLALGSAVLFGLTVTLIRSLRRNNGPVVIYLYFCTMGMFITLPAFLGDPRLPATGMEWLLCIIMIAFSVAAQVSMNQGFFYCRGWEGGVFMTMDALFSVMAGVIFLKEPLTWRLFVGGGMILSGIIVMNLMSARRVKTG